MSYIHMFYGLDLGRLQSIYGSRDESFLAEVLQQQAEALADNDGFFEDAIAAGDCPKSETALREIIAGSLGQYERAEAMYGYVLKILCEHLGQRIGEDVAAVRDHAYKSQLVAAGPPIPIPYDRSDFPEIGFLALADIPQEIERIDKAPKRARRSLLLSLICWLTHGMVGRQMSDEEATEDMQAYRNTLDEARRKGISVVSFRH